MASIGTLLLFLTLLLLLCITENSKSAESQWNMYCIKSLAHCHGKLSNKLQALVNLQTYLSSFKKCHFNLWLQCQSMQVTHVITKGTHRVMEYRPCYYDKVILAGVLNAQYMIKVLPQFQTNLTVLQFRLVRNLYGCDLQYVKVSK